MRRLRQLLPVLALLSGAAIAAPPALATPEIDISFDSVDDAGRRLIHAEALFPVAGNAVQRVFAAIAAYPALHDWIVSTRHTASGPDGEEFLVEFRFPWPVGQQWSRVEVRRRGDSSIEWRQIEGSLKANHGRIAFASRGANAHIDYRAIIDVGYPEPLTRPYKKRFVSEFMQAVYLQARAADGVSGVALASR